MLWPNSFDILVRGSIECENSFGYDGDKAIPIKHLH